MGYKPKEIRYDLLGAKVVENLQKRHFDAYYCQTKEDALKKAIELIPEDDVVSWGGSVSIDEIGLLNYVKENRQVIDRDSAKSPEERVHLMRQSLLVYFFPFLIPSNFVLKILKLRLFCLLLVWYYFSIIIRNMYKYVNIFVDI